MFITLTNANELFKGDTIAINIDLIATIYNKKEDSNIKNISYVFCPPHGIWEVQETVDEVVAEINNLKWNKK